MHLLLINSYKIRLTGTYAFNHVVQGINNGEWRMKHNEVQELVINLGKVSSNLHSCFHISDLPGGASTTLMGGIISSPSQPYQGHRGWILHRVFSLPVAQALDPEAAWTASVSTYNLQIHKHYIFPILFLYLRVHTVWRIRLLTQEYLFLLFCCFASSLLYYPTLRYLLRAFVTLNEHRQRSITSCHNHSSLILTSSNLFGRVLI